VFVIATQDKLLTKTLNGAHEAYSRGAKIILATQMEDEKELDFVCQKIKLPKLDSYLMPILSIIPFQYLAYYTSIAKSINPDKPRNLAKSVTVE
jgi:glucosamine--fructose-6-phosphate aminotransferase (isomerizing)